MKKILVPTLIALALGGVSGLAQAQTATPESSLSYNAGVTTDYRYRGISQSRLKPAVQGGIDYADKSGFYVGAWGSSIKWVKDAGGDSGMELDLYGGYKGAVGDVAYDVGFLRYEYAGNKLAVSANTNEIYGAATYGPATLKYSHAVSNLFGFANSKNSYYVDLSATFDLGNGYALTPHVGRQMVKNSPGSSYNDFALTLGKDLGNGLSATAAVVDTTTGVYVYNDKNLGKTGLVLGLKYAF
ncbi:MAG: TorF family putative porin [Limnohabitans sp.]|nr:TorF family putative porin [Limnohabitans sp.]